MTQHLNIYVSKQHAKSLLEQELMPVTITSINWWITSIRKLIWALIIESLITAWPTETSTASVCLSEIDNRDDKIDAEACMSVSKDTHFRPSQSSLTCLRTSSRVLLQVTSTWEALANDMLEACCCKATHRHTSVINPSAIVTVNLISTKMAHNCLTVSRGSAEVLSTLLTPVKVSSCDHSLLIRSREIRRIIVTVTLVSLWSKHISRCAKASSYVLLACNIQVRACERVGWA